MPTFKVGLLILTMMTSMHEQEAQPDEDSDRRPVLIASVAGTPWALLTTGKGSGRNGTERPDSARRRSS